MKKCLLLLSLFITGVFLSSGQNSDRSELSYGAVGGFTSVLVNAKVSVNIGGETLSSELDENRSGFYIGGFVEIPVATNFTVQPEVYYAGVKDFNQLIIPVLAKYYIGDFSIHLGPQVSFILSDKEDVWGTNSSDFSTFSIGGAVGLGYDFSSKLFANIRFTGQLNDYYTGDLDFEATAGNFTIGLGYRF